MNLSKLTLDSVLEEDKVDTSPILRQRETELVEVITALENIQSSQYWKSLQTKLFKPELTLLQKKLQEEEKDIEVFRLQGRIKEASKFDDFSKLISMKRNELQNIRQQLNGNKE